MEQPEPERLQRARIDNLRLDPEIVELHLQANQPVEAEKARMIYLMNLRLNGIDPEFDSDFGPGIARDGDW